MKKFLLTLIVTMLAFVGAWAQGTQASKSVYKFTSTAQGNLYTTTDGETYTEATTTQGEVCGQNYFVLSQYKKADSDPSTESITAFGVKTYYVKGTDSYTCAYGTAYNAANTYATVVSPVEELTGDALNDKLSTVWRWSASAVGYGIHKKVNEELVPVEEGEEINLSADYWPNKTNTSWIVTGNDLKSWGDPAYGIQKSNFLSTEGIYTLVGDIYVPLSTTDFDADEHYYTLVFSDLDETAEAAMADEATNFATTTTLTGLSTPNSGIFYFDGVSYTEAKNGDEYHAGCYYIKEDSYAEKTPAELYALGYVDAETTLYRCFVEKSGKTITITYDYSADYNGATKTFVDFITECRDEISGCETVEIKSNDATNGQPGGLSPLFTAIQPCDGVLNLILNDMANNGYHSTNKVDLTNLNGSSIKRVVLPKTENWNDARLGTDVTNTNASDEIIVPIVQAYNTSTTDFTVHSYVAGSLNAIAESHYTTDEVTGAYWIEFGGNLNTSDLTFISGVQTDKINMMSATVADTEKGTFITALNSFANGNITYLGLPDLGVNKPANTLVDAIYDNNPQLIGIGHVNLADKSFYGSIRDTEDAGSTVHNEGTLKILTGYAVAGSHRGMANVILANSEFEEVHVAGNLNARDVTAQADASIIDAAQKKVDGTLEPVDAYISTAGHWVTNDDPEKAADQNGAFSGMYGCTVLGFEDAKFEVSTDLNPAVSGMLNSSTTNVILPIDASFTEIAHFSFKNMGNAVTSFTIPGNIKIIGDYAFYDDGNMVHVKTTAVDSDGNGSYADEDIIDNGIYSMTLPAGLTHIGTGCFWNDNKFMDVYVLATTAPVCEKDAFDSNSYTGNNGFDATNGVNQGAYCRENQLTYAVLHYPSELYGKDEELKYTDVTREYTLEDNDHKTDANGNILTWPAQEEWNHAYVTASTGTLWNAWDKSITSAEQWTFHDIPTLEDVATKKGSAVEDQYKYTDYIGWHQFILANRLNSKKDKEIPTRDFSRFKENDWYTICVPYSLRKSDLLKIFGAEYSEYPGTTITTLDGTSKTVNADVYPEVRTLVGVTRNDVTGQITLKMSKDLIESTNCLSTIPSGGAEPAYTAYEDADPIVIKEGYPYIIRPYLPAEKKALSNAGKYLVQVEEEANHLENTGVRVPFTSHIITALDQSGTVLNDWTYQFVGAYTTHKLPAYSYYMSKSKSKQKNIWFYFQPAGYNINATTEEEKAENEAKLTKIWNPYGSIIAAKPSVSIFIPTSDQAKAGQTPSMSFQGNDDSFSEFGGAKSSNYVMEFDEDGATGINEVNANKVMNNNVFYNLNGQSVGTSAENVPSGIYIINGKKVVVK